MTISTNLSHADLDKAIEFLEQDGIEFKHSMSHEVQSSFYFEYNSYIYFVHYFNGKIDVLNKIKSVIKVAPNISVSPMAKDLSVKKSTVGAVTIYSDGACKPNPGKAGIGLAIYHDAVYQYSLYGRYIEQGTNNIAELTAFLEGIRMAKMFLNSGVGKVIFYTDSEYSIKCVTEWAANWKKNNWRTASKQPVKNKELVEEIYEIYCEISDKLKINHVNGHVGIEGNEIADKMAGHAVKTMTTTLQRCDLSISDILRL